MSMSQPTVANVMKTDSWRTSVPVGEISHFVSFSEAYVQVGLCGGFRCAMAETLNTGNLQSKRPLVVIIAP